MKHLKLIGPFAQIVTLQPAPLAGSIADEQLGIIDWGGVVVEGIVSDGGTIIEVGNFTELRRKYPDAENKYIEKERVLLPGFIDCHTHLCWAGSRAEDFALRNTGTPYLDIAKQGGGIMSTVRQTRAASDADLMLFVSSRLRRLHWQGITTVECKSGYGLSAEEELRHLGAIAQGNFITAFVDVVPTCLAAHVCPPEFAARPADYLEYLAQELLPQLKVLRGFKHRPRIDAFAEPSAFWGEPLQKYLAFAKTLGFPLTVHADQFTPGGAKLAMELGAQSADHLEHTSEKTITAFGKFGKQHQTVAVALPGASIGLGEPFTPARKLLDAGACLAIASDWNPGSAPQGQLLAQACILAAAQKISNAELLAGITFRAAQALGLSDRGRIAPGMRADLVQWPTKNYQDICWNMGSMAPIIDV